MKAYPAYKDSGTEWIGNIPTYWKLGKLSEHANIINGFPFNSEYFNQEKGIPVIRIRDITTGKTETLYSGKYPEESIMDNGDILIGMDGDFLARWWEGGKAVLNQRCCCLRTLFTIEKRFLFYTLQFPLNIINDLTYFTTVKHLSSGDIRKITIPFPPLPEQQAIASFLDRKTALIDRLIEKKQRQIALLQEQRTALINHAVTKGLDPHVEMKDSGVDWLGQVPRHWEVSTVRYFYDAKLGKMLDSSKQNEDDLKKPYLRAANIHWNKILLDEVGVNEMGFTKDQLSRYLLQSGDILVTEGGVTVGRSAIWNGELPECYYQNSLNRARSLKETTTKWLYYWMFFVTNNGFVDILADKATFGHLTNEKLRALPIPIPPHIEELEIIAKLETFEPKVESQIKLIRKQIELLQEYRTTLISAAVTGKIDVREEGALHL